MLASNAAREVTMDRSNDVAGAQVAAAVAGVVFLAITVPLFGIVMLPVVAVAAAGRALGAALSAVGTVSLIE
jgi:hypothetical protein